MLSSRSYTSRNLLTPFEKESKYKSDYQTTSFSSMNKSFEEKPNSDKYSDNEFELNMDNY